MRRRSAKNDPGSADEGPVAPEHDALDDAGPEGGLEDKWAQWEEKWDRPEEERVARWLRAKVHPEADIDLRDQPDGRSGADRWQGETGVSFLDEQRRRMTATVEAQRLKAERVRWQQREVKARLEAELSELDQERARLAAAVEAERLEAERLHNEQLEVRARLETEVSHLDEETQRLAATVEAKRAEAERVRREQQEVRGRLEAELAALDEQRLKFVAAVDAEREEAERLHDEQLEARARLEAHVADLQRQRQRFAEAIESKRSQIESEAVEKGRPDIDLDAIVAEATAAEATAAETTAAEAIRVEGIRVEEVRVEVEEDVEAKAKLAAAVSELAQYLTAAQEAERAEAERVAQEQPDDDGSSRAEDWPTAEQAPQPHSRRARRRQARLVPGWLVMTVLALGPVGLMAFEVASPLVVRSQLEGVARDAADRAVTELLDHNDVQRARLVAEAIAKDEDAVVTSLTVDQRGLRVVIEREAQSLVLKHLGRTASWYNVEVTATAATPRN